MKNRRKAVQPFEIKKRKIDIFRNYEANGFEKNQRKFENFSTLISKKSTQIFENNGTFCADRPFSKNRPETNCQKSFIFNQLVSELQSYILSITTET